MRKLFLIIILIVVFLVLSFGSLVFIFPGSTTTDNLVKEIEDPAQVEIIKMRITYKECRPSESEEISFKEKYGVLTEIQKNESIQNFKSLIQECGALSQEACTSRCIWS